MENLPQPLKLQLASFLCPSDVVSLSLASKALREDLSFARIPMRIPFKSWYDEPLHSESEGMPIRRGPKIPFLPGRTHSVTLEGEWSCRFGELQGRQNDINSQAQFYIAALPLECDHPYESERREVIRKAPLTPDTVTRKRGGDHCACVETGPSWLCEGGRVVWSSLPLCRRYYQCTNSNSSWLKLSVTFIPCKGEEYFLCIQAGPGTASHQQRWRHSLHMSNLIAHIAYHDNPHTDFLLKRQYKVIVRHMLQVENRGAFHTKILEAVARSIRIQLTRFGRNALDPFLDSFFQSTGVPRDSDSLLVLEEIARFISYYAYINERREKCNNSNPEGDSEKNGGAISSRDSVPDWLPYVESSVTNRSIRDLSHKADDDGNYDSAARASGALVPSVPSVPEQDGLRKQQSSSRFKRAAQTLRKLPSSLWRVTRGKGVRRHQARRPGWIADEVTEEFSISVGLPTSGITNDGISDEVN